jgi:hypothetical protein
MSFELSELQFGTIKLTCNLSMHQPQVNIVYHDHFAIIIWFSTHITVYWPKRSNFINRTFKLKIQLLVFTENLAKQLVLVAQSILVLDNSQGKTIERYIITYIGVGDVPWRFAMRQRTVKSPFLHLGFSSSYELEEYSLEKLKLLRAAHAQDMIF